MKWKVVFSLLLPIAAAQATTTQYPVTVDSCGIPLTIEKHPTHAVFHDINMAEMAFALGLQDDMAGVTGITGWYKMSPEFKHRLGGIPELAPKYPSLETLMAAQVDFFFAGWNYGMKVGGEVTPETLAPYGIDTLVLSESCVHTRSEQKKSASMDLLYTDILKLGVIFDRQDKANALVNGWKQRIAALPKPTSNAKAPKVFLYDSGQDKPFTAGQYAMPDAMIRVAGGVNVTHDMQTSWATTSWETVAKENPDVIILLDYQNANGASELQRYLEQHPLMKYTKAVKNKRYIKLRYEQLTPGPANIDAVEKMARAFAQ
ncbi:ABC transporter substrate-binding protein [Vibrio ostreae]|uniref:ABC transporter substrate-binding protein n=1 Tax=Vibrio ostreae TaxID=2841925 RepID=A0A975U7M1_9VIBR|nr:ABC transporter substrate-binding protein [Vibrio ostreae]QXO15852.1 ABC transporter substrate-binding protein [Vibrio ostreae]